MRDELDKTLDQFRRLHPQKIDLSLGRIEKLLDKLGKPQETGAQVIHIAGTNGKGSTITFLRYLLEAHEKRVHVYTSPHLLRFNERIRLGGKLIKDETLIALLDEIQKINEGAPLTFFEATTAVALLAFSRHEADYWLIETGLGGRYDATNIFKRKALSLITPIGLDHAEFLGTDIKKIAREKAGIFSQNSTTFSSPQSQDVRAALTNEAKITGTDIEFLNRQHLAGLDAYGPLGLAGTHQTTNAALALEAAKFCLGREIRDEKIRMALNQTCWPARLTFLTKLEKENLGLARFGQVIVDGAHNVHAAMALADYLRQRKADNGDKFRKIILLWAMPKRKDAEAFLHPLIPFLDGVFSLTLPASTPGYSAQELQVIAENQGIKARALREPGTDWAGLTDELDLPGESLLLCTGSLYFAAWLLGKAGVEID